jgi:hypothetical protein
MFKPHPLTVRQGALLDSVVKTADQEVAAMRELLL